MRGVFYVLRSPVHSISRQGLPFGAIKQGKDCRAVFCRCKRRADWDCWPRLGISFRALDRGSAPAPTALPRDISEPEKQGRLTSVPEFAAKGLQICKSDNAGEQNCITKKALQKFAGLPGKFCKVFAAFCRVASPETCRSVARAVRPRATVIRRRSGWGIKRFTRAGNPTPRGSG